MIRIPRAELDYAIAAVRACANAARDRAGLRVLFPLSDDQAERAILAALATLAPGTIPQVVMPADVHEVQLEPVVSCTERHIIGATGGDEALNAAFEPEPKPADHVQIMHDYPPPKSRD